MIEVFAKLDRGTVYLAGESIEGQVTFTNKGLFIFIICYELQKKSFVLYKLYEKSGHEVRTTDGCYGLAQPSGCRKLAEPIFRIRTWRKIMKFLVLVKVGDVLGSLFIPC